MKRVTQKEINRAWAEYQSRVNQYGEHEMGAQRALQKVYELKALWEKQNPGRKSNPSTRGKKLRELTIDQLQIAALKAFPSSPYQKTIQAEIKKRLASGEKPWLPPATRRKSNPSPRGPAGGERLEMLKQAAKLYREFTGDEGELVAKVKKLVWPQVATVIGEMDGVLYSTVRDGVDEKYIHRFKKSARPLLCVSHDGSMLVIVLGKYRFTDRGIVDK